MNRALLLILVAAVVPGCLFGSEKKTHQTGDYVPPEILEKIAMGDRQETVVSLLGEPTTKTAASDGTDIWMWVHSEETTQKGAVFLILSKKETTTKTVTVFVEFRNGLVSRTWRG